ncbi:MAG: replication-associated recombination protein A [Planctomycetota bacterium]|nr:replication-associated recombination protein A [Planctomycetota bacterium]
MRPSTLDEFLGQEDLLGKGKPLRQMIESDEISSMILWGPPGCGKTTLARIISTRTGMRFRPLSAVTSGIRDVKKVIDEAKAEREATGAGTILFVDEIHRFNRAQQDAFLPHVEDGVIALIGATTENPSFEVISPLLSRCRVFVLQALDPEQIETLIRRALDDSKRGLGGRALEVDEEALGVITGLSDGDARRALNLLEAAANLAGAEPISGDTIRKAAQSRVLIYDKAGEQHFNLISALHKSLRGGDADASLYWLARMMEAGEDPLYIARRMVRFASEDIGLADPQALPMSMAATEAVRFMGLPEGELALAELAIYLALAPKSNLTYSAYGAAKDEVREKGSLPVPMEIRNAPTRLMKDVGYGKGYEYPHDAEGGVVDQKYLPDGAVGGYYRPKDAGFERELSERLERWNQIRKDRKKSS